MNYLEYNRSIDLNGMLPLTHTIEFSSDKGASWSQYRRTATEPHALTIQRIVAMNAAGYKVRFGVDEKVIDMTTGQNFFRANNPSTMPANKWKSPGQQHTKSEYRYVFYNDERGYYVETLSTMIKDREICRVEHKIVYDMKVPNENLITKVNPLNSVDEANDGFVFHVSQPTAQQETEWGPLLLAAPQSQKLPIEQFVVVDCARVGDREMEVKYFQGGPVVVSVIGNKYVTNNFDKLGSRFLVHKTYLAKLIETCRQRGGWVQFFDMNEEDVANPNLPKPQGVSMPIANADIANVTDTLRKLLDEGDTDKLSEAIFLAIEYRDRTIAELKALNEMIQQTKEVVLKGVNPTT